MWNFKTIGIAAENVHSIDMNVPFEHILSCKKYNLVSDTHWYNTAHLQINVVLRHGFIQMINIVHIATDGAYSLLISVQKSDGKN